MTDMNKTDSHERGANACADYAPNKFLDDGGPVIKMIGSFNCFSADSNAVWERSVNETEFKHWLKLAMFLNKNLMPYGVYADKGPRLWVYDKIYKASLDHADVVGPVLVDMITESGGDIFDDRPDPPNLFPENPNQLQIRAQIHINIDSVCWSYIHQEDADDGSDWTEYRYVTDVIPFLDIQVAFERLRANKKFDLVENPEACGYVIESVEAMKALDKQLDGIVAQETEEQRKRSADAKKAQEQRVQEEKLKKSTIPIYGLPRLKKDLSGLQNESETDFRKDIVSVQPMMSVADQFVDCTTHVGGCPNYPDSDSPAQTTFDTTVKPDGCNHENWTEQSK